MKSKKPIYKRWWFWLIIIILAIGGSNGSSSGTNKTNSANSYQKNKSVEVIIADFTAMTEDEALIWFDDNKINGTISKEYSDTVEKGNFISQSIEKDTVAHEGDKITVTYSLGREPTVGEKNALKKAESYSNTLHMSKSAIYKQLVSEYGEGFTAQEAQYAIDNMVADWNANALKKAESYSNTMHMSKKGIYKQLVSEYGEGFTADEAQYAVDNMTADWNANALAKAKSYQNNMSMSKSAIYNQLVSEYGEGFTAEEAQYAIDNLED